jgi:ParB-like chromosome segregation protein Spo0J
LNIENWPIERPNPYPNNARKLSGNAIDKVGASLQEFGWRQPIVVDAKGVIICGHTRWLAARKLGFQTVPVHVAENLTPVQVKAYRLM